MSTQAVEILIKNIKTDPEYYPRFQPDQERIKEFVEAMECCNCKLVNPILLTTIIERGIGYIFFSIEETFKSAHYR